MKRYISITEKRRNPDKNIHIDAWEYLEQYMNNPDVYISFTTIDKIGINPRSKYNTPVGIYCYPLVEFVKEYIHKSIKDIKYKTEIGDYALFAGKAEYINFLEVKDKTNFVNDMYSDYTSQDYDRDIGVLQKKYEKEYEKVNISIYAWDEFIKEAEETAKEHNPIMSMWNITRKLSKVLAKDPFSGKEGNPIIWNKILRNLGYSGFGDKSGKGYIHSSEPMQAIFLRKNAFELLHRVENIPSKITSFAQKQKINPRKFKNVKYPRG